MDCSDGWMFICSTSRYNMILKLTTKYIICGAYVPIDVYTSAENTVCFLAVFEEMLSVLQLTCIYRVSLCTCIYCIEQKVNWQALS